MQAVAQDADGQAKRPGEGSSGRRVEVSLRVVLHPITGPGTSRLGPITGPPGGPQVPRHEVDQRLLGGGESAQPLRWWRLSALLGRLRDGRMRRSGVPQLVRVSVSKQGGLARARRTNWARRSAMTPASSGPSGTQASLQGRWAGALLVDTDERQHVDESLELSGSQPHGVREAREVRHDPSMEPLDRLGRSRLIVGSVLKELLGRDPRRAVEVALRDIHVGLRPQGLSLGEADHPSRYLGRWPVA